MNEWFILIHLKISDWEISLNAEGIYLIQLEIPLKENKLSAILFKCIIISDLFLNWYSDISNWIKHICGSLRDTY